MMSGYGRLTQGSQTAAYTIETSQSTVQNVERAPDDYICLSLFMMFFCCPIGVAALCKSFSVEQQYGAGDVGGAQRASRCALILNIIGIALGSLAIITAVIIVAIVYS
ncbi:transmembrane protein 91-like [Corticium candelabrum]|uniref:transmembrane protein 91-like n=1 Tax=Corticium candelabrum TaxID=121492 RepID=UPI002E262034|nr:transmembrane protein 91-like [Corticium candelabrum]XP_062518183.1 transmembrane protein 91-like [Corticium candelabrum]